jgi:hypothetical protein
MHGLVHICKSDAYRWHCQQHMHLEMMFASLQIKYDCIYTYVHWSEVFGSRYSGSYTATLYYLVYGHGWTWFVHELTSGSWQSRIDMLARKKNANQKKRCIC